MFIVMPIQGMYFDLFPGLVGAFSTREKAELGIIEYERYMRVTCPFFEHSHIAIEDLGIISMIEVPYMRHMLWKCADDVYLVVEREIDEMFPATTTAILLEEEKQ